MKLLEPDDLKDWLHKKLSREDKLLLILAAAKDCRASLTEIKELSKNAGLRDVKNWNISSYLAKSKGKAISSKGRWELRKLGITHLQEIGVGKIKSATAEVAIKLRKHLKGIKNEQTRNFLETAILCHEYKFYRPAILMSWMSALQILQQYVIDHYADAFNDEASSSSKHWKRIKKLDDFSDVITESKFLTIITDIGMIDSGHTDELRDCLKLRNRCCHPNPAKIGINKSEAHIESLILHVFEEFN